MIGRRFVAAGLVVAAVASGGVVGAVIGVPGLSSASPSSPVTPVSSAGPHEGRHIRDFPGPSLGAGKDVLDAAAKALDLSTKDLLAKVSDGKTTIADVAKQQSVDVQSVIAAMEAVAEDSIEKLVNNPFPTRLGKHDGKGLRRGGVHGFGRRGIRSSLDSVAKVLGMSTADLRTALRNGQSLADIAKAKNVNVKSVVDALVNEAKSRIDDAVNAGKLKRDQATRLESKLEKKITKAVNKARGKGHGPMGRIGRRFAPGNRHGPPGLWPGPAGASVAPPEIPSLSRRDR